MSAAIESQEFTRTCEVLGCERKHAARGLCLMHYKRRLRGRDLLDDNRVTADPRHRLMAKVRVVDGCWIWTGARNKAGYGVIGAGRRGDGTVLAHRLSYEIHKGAIPEGLHLDHLCVTPARVRPEHLEAVTQQENNRREHARQAERAA